MKFPQSAVLELTYKCNHLCKFCSCPWENPSGGFEKGGELTTEQWFQVIDKVLSNGSLTITFTGGEAILRTDIKEIINYASMAFHKREMSSRIVLISNGRSLTDELLECFRQNNVQLSLSLPGYKTFKEHTGVDNAEGVLNWIKKSHDAGLRTTANITVTKLNYDELFKTMSLALIAGADTVLLNRFLPGGRGLQYRQTLELTKEQINGMLDTAEEVLSYADRYGFTGTEFPKCIIKKGIDHYKHLKIGTHCSAAKSFFVISPNGSIRVCNHSPRVVGHIFSTPEITDTAYWNTFINSTYKPLKCASCPQVQDCDAGCREVAHILNGSPSATDPLID